MMVGFVHFIMRRFTEDAMIQMAMIHPVDIRVRAPLRRSQREDARDRHAAQ
jgi:hypothetical protein